MIDRQLLQQKINNLPSPPPSPPKTKNQENLVNLLKPTNIIEKLIIIDGLAGTGKTLLKIASMLENLKAKKVDRLIISYAHPTIKRHSLGFLPGGMRDKITPYISHIMEYIKELGNFNENALNILIKDEILVIKSFQYMQGKTFKNSFVFVDECQNLLKEDIKLLTSRIGSGSTLVMSGDTMQSNFNDIHNKRIDYPFYEYISLLKKHNIPNTHIVKLTQDDIIRSKLAKDNIMMFMNEGW